MIYQQVLVCVDSILVMGGKYTEKEVIDKALDIALTANPEIPKVRRVAEDLYQPIDHELTILACRLLAEQLNFEGLYYIVCEEEEIECLA